MTTVLLLCIVLASLCFLNIHSFKTSRFLQFKQRHIALDALTENNNADSVSINVPLGDGYQNLPFAFRPIFEKSVFFTVTYAVPFGLNVEKQQKGFPAPIVTKDSKNEEGEKKGDVLRATTCWSQGFQAAGATSDIAMFAGNIKWRKSLFDTTGAPWDEVVKALISNTNERSKEVTLVFERMVDDDTDEVAPSS